MEMIKKEEGLNFSCKEYRSTDNKNTIILKDIDFYVPAGSVAAIIGPSGTGKSTILRLIAGLQKSESVNISHRGLMPLELQKMGKISMSFQQPALLPWRNVIDNIKIPFEISGKRADQKILHDGLKIVHLMDNQKSMPATLSGGMAQRVELARAIVTDSDILLLDEPFSSLDDNNRYDLLQNLMDIWEIKNRTMIIVTHNLHEAVFLADKVILLQDKLPGTIQEVFGIDLPRPRKIDIMEGQSFIDKVKEIRRHFQSQKKYV